MRFKYIVEVEVERESGKFASRDEINDVLVEALGEAESADLDGLGSDGESVYTITSFEVSTT
jgi:hypothetical protein